jgi:uncharacterized protein YaiE (UPF0345 family)
MSNQIVISSGAKVRELEGVITGASGILSSVPYGGANGVATLDSSGKVPVYQLPASVVTYLGTWNAATNTPTLTNGTGDAGDMYLCNVAGTVNFGAGPITFAVGDWVLYGSGTWQKSNGQNGTVTSVAASITGNSLGITGSPITTAGTLAFAFAGTNAQYINGAGNLTTFPNLTGYVPYTGATSDVNLGLFDLKTAKVWLYDVPNSGYGSMELTDGVLHFEDADGHSMVTMEDGYLTIANASTIRALLNVSGLSANRDYAFPNASGTLALLESTQTFSGTNTFSASVINDDGLKIKFGSASNLTASYLTLSAYGLTTPNRTVLRLGTTASTISELIFSQSSSYAYTFPSVTGTLALTSDLSSYVPYTGATTNVDLGSRDLTSNGLISNIGIKLSQSSGYNGATGYTIINGTSSGIQIRANTTNILNLYFPAANNDYTFPNASGTLALTSNLSSYVPYSGATTNVDLGVYNLTSQHLIANGNTGIAGTLQLKQAASPAITNGYTGIYSSGPSLTFYSDWTGGKIANFSLLSITASRTFTLPNLDGTLALGTGTTNYHSKWTASGVLGNSLIWDNGTNVGIGNTNTSYTLDVSGTGRFTGNVYLGTSSGNVLVNATTLDATSGANFQLNGSFQSTGSSLVAAPTTASIIIDYQAAGNVGRIMAGSAAAWNKNLALNPYGGNVGIGTSSPSALLAVQGASSADGFGFFMGGSGATLGGIKMGNSGSTYASLYFDNSTNDVTLFQQYATGNLRFGTASTERMRIKSTGDIKIVTGNLLGWSDYSAGTTGVGLVGSGENLLFYSSGSERMRITSGGNVGIGNAGSSSIKMYLTSIGTTSSTYAVRFEDSSTNGLFYIRDDGYINSGVSSNSPYNLVRTGRVMMVDSGGGVGYQSSTRESKTNISNLTDVSFLYKLNPVSFNYRKSDGESNTFTDEFNEDLHYGLIADEVEKVNKELVFYNEKDGVKELAGVEYGKLTAVLIKAIQELSKELSDLKEIVATK